MKKADRGRRYFLMLYYQRLRDLGYQSTSRPGPRPFHTQIHKVRDGLAAAEIASVLHSAGFHYGGAILNVPLGLRKSLDGAGGAMSAPVGLRPNDLLWLPTRPPLDDDGAEAKRALNGSGTELERTVLGALRPFFAQCSRSDIVLESRLVAKGAAGDVKRLRAVTFYQSKGGRVMKLNAMGRGQAPLEADLTLGYLASVPAVAPTGFRMLAAFGMGGTETLWLSHLLRCSYAGILADALKTVVPQLWVIPFLVPQAVPQPMLGCEPSALRPRKELTEPICFVTQSSGVA